MRHSGRIAQARFRFPGLKILPFWPTVASKAGPDVIHNLLTRSVKVRRVQKAEQKQITSHFKRAFGNAVRQHRKKLEISQDELAWRAGVHRTYVTNVERGICNPSLASIAKIARALGTTAATLLADAESANAAVTRGLDILLIEDNRYDAELTIEALKRAGLANTVHIARDGVEALEYLFDETHAGGSKATPRLILLDLNLPRISGLEVLQRLKSDQRTAGIPVVVLTASRTDRDIAECRRLGAKSYIVKPVNFHNLSEVTPQLNLCWLLLQNPARVAA